MMSARLLVLMLFTLVIAALFLCVMQTRHAAVDARRQHDTYVAIHELGHKFELYLVEFKGMPKGDVSSVVSVVDSTYGRLSPEVVALAESGKDAWGTTLVWAPIGENSWVLRSAGANHVDEFGQGDDIQFIVDESLGRD
ncbi:hypothetical protein C5Y93_22875 [Blastopirellula marina]|uniref:Type II secretion system protein GspG C-terminal domain-containing protein n=1 Tax=Blastopirellula marina TaxID=124 RepID=A0A2S8GGV6_9BACT|nr:hypothetical protein C5Y93_22875 [Blastopirellula marina]